MQSLIDFAYAGPALSSASGKSQWVSGDAFIGVQSGAYWSSTTDSGSPPFAWYVDLAGGYVGIGSKSGAVYVWPVRTGQ
jgi:hypothetical protein